MKDGIDKLCVAKDRTCRLVLYHSRSRSVKTKEIDEHRSIAYLADGIHDIQSDAYRDRHRAVSQDVEET